MIDELDAEKDHIGLIRHEDFVCGACRHLMIPLSKGRYQCPKCGVVFEDDLGEPEFA